MAANFSGAVGQLGGLVLAWRWPNDLRGPCANGDLIWYWVA